MANAGLPPISGPTGLSSIQNVRKLPGAPIPGVEKPKEGNNFADLLKDALSTTNRLMVESGQKSRAFVAGETRNVHEVMIEMEKSGLAFRLVTQVRNKAVEAYREIFRMQM